jgi:radical SAM superfamily enzyme YgiQ (UPF0313 family)
MTERVLFVAPAKLYPVDAEGNPIQHVRENVSLPALTVLGSLKSAGFDVDFMDLSADDYQTQTRLNEHTYRFGLPDEAVVDKIKNTKPFALLLTSMFSTEQQMVDDLTSEVKRAYPTLPIIAGGIHATLQPDWTLEQGNIDFVVLGEGEETTGEVLIQIQSEGVDAVKSRGRIVNAESRLQNLDKSWALDEVLLRDGNYRYNDRASRRSKIYAHLTQADWVRNFSLYYSRGCPTHCDYCTTSEKDGKKVRHMGSERMLRDFRLLHEKYGVHIFYNQADTFGLHPEDIEFLRKVEEYRKDYPDFVLNNPNAFFIRIFFPKSNRYELDEELLDLFAGAGFNVMTLAVETFNQRYNKKIDFNNVPHTKIKDLTRAIHDRGMKTELYMMYAFPGQTPEELVYDERMVEAFPDVDEVAWQNCMVFPGTQYYRKGLKEGWFTEASYRATLREGYFFHYLPETFNFSKIPTSELSAFRDRHAPNFS